ncbi:MAG TPA: hypothetical protein VNV37_12855 [Solirubrobacteraceae bacterium]|jgi:hypothetical protein|nr:hypothetical protein [Solirubrobacteraceae bacterium]
MSGQGPTKSSLEEGIPSIETKLPVVLNKIHEAAPKARIWIPLYPQLLDSVPGGDITVGSYFFRAPVIEHDVAIALENFVNKLNQTITSIVTKWASTTRAQARVVKGTVHAFEDTSSGINPMKCG